MNNWASIYKDVIVFSFNNNHSRQGLANDLACLHIILINLSSLKISLNISEISVKF